MAPPGPTDNVPGPGPGPHHGSDHDAGAQRGTSRHGTVLGLLAKEGIHTQIALVETPTDLVGPQVEPRRAEGDSADLGGKYRVLGEIGAGGMGVILRCRDADIGRDVAAKVLHERYRDDPAFLQRFVEEAQINGQLQHPGIVPIYEMGMEERRIFFTMKLIKGRTLTELLKARSDPKADRPRFLGIFLQVCQTMAYAHARGVIHRDLKPSNVMVGAFGEVIVVDWGLAKVLSGEASAPEDGSKARSAESVIATLRSQRGGAQSVAGSVMGTPAYMPPEQAAGDIERLDARSDVFSLGAILCEIITGRPPYEGEQLAEIVRQAASARLEEARRRLEASGAETELVELVGDCLRPSPLLRPKDAGEVAERVSRHLTSVELRAQEAQIVAAEERVKAVAARRAQRLTQALAAAVLCLIVLGLGGYAWIEGDRASRVAEATRGIHDALQEAARIRGEDPAPSVAQVEKALAVLRTAERLVATPGMADALRSRLGDKVRTLERDRAEASARVEAAARDERMRARLEGIMTPPDSELELTGFDTREALRKDSAFGSAFEEYGLDLRKLSRDEVVSRVERSDIRVDLAVALENWAMAREYLQRLALARGGGPRADPSSWRYLLEVARDADDDPLRRKHRESILTGRFNLDSLDALVASADLTATPPMTVVLLALSFERLGQPEKGVALLRQAQRMAPGDFNLNLQLGTFLERRRPPSWADSVRFYTAALAARPRSLVALHRLGSALESSGDADGALEVFQEAIRLDPRQSDWHVHRRRILETANRDLDGAMAESRAALAIDPENASEHLALAKMQVERAQLADAAASYRSYLGLQGTTWREWRSLANANRYEAACVAVLAGGSGRDGVASATGDRAAWRLAALRWLEDELRLKLLCLIGRPASAPERIRQDLRLWLSEGRLGGVRDPDAILGLPPQEREAWERLWRRVRRVLAQLEVEPRLPSAPANEAPTGGIVVTQRVAGAGGSPDAGGAVELRTSPFHPGAAGSVHAFTLWQVRDADGDYALHPVYSALSDGALIRLELPAGLFLSGSSYYWRAAHVSEDGSVSGFSAETLFKTGDLPWRPVPIDLSRHFDRDLVADAGDDATDSIDYGEGFLIEDGFDGTRADNAEARGLPRSRTIGVHRLGDYGGPNAVQFERGSRGTVRVEVPRGRYVAFRFLVSGGNGDSTIPLAIEHADGSAESLVLRCDDWFEDIPPNGFGPLGEGVVPIWNGMDRLFAGHFEDVGQAALFEVLLPARTEAEVTALVLEPERGTFDLPYTRFNLFAVTGMALSSRE